MQHYTETKAGVEGAQVLDKCTCHCVKVYLDKKRDVFI